MQLLFASVSINRFILSRMRVLVCTICWRTHKMNGITIEVEQHTPRNAKFKDHIEYREFIDNKTNKNKNKRRNGSNVCFDAFEK